MTKELEHSPGSDGPCSPRGGECAILDALPAAVYLTDAAGRITYFNEAAVQLAGRRPEIGKDEWCVTWRLYRPDGTSLPHDECPMAVALKEDRAVRGERAIVERPDGTRIPMAPYPTPLHDSSGKLVGAVNLLVDMSDESAAETARAYLAAIVESSDDAIVSKDLNGIITSWNHGAERIFGYMAEEMIGRSMAVLFPHERLHEEDMILARLRRGERVDHFESARRHKDGHEISVSVTVSPIRDGAGRIVGASNTSRDITESKRAEALLRDLNEYLEQRVNERTRELADSIERERAHVAERERTEAALRQAQKMEAVGQLAAGMAHDFNNLLTGILGILELIDKRHPDQRTHKLVEAAISSVQRGARLNEQVLTFSRKQHLLPKAVDLNALVAGLEDMLARTLGGTIAVRSELSKDLWPTLVDPQQLELVILNLAVNARDAMPLGGELVVETRNVKAVEVDPSLNLAPGDYVRVSVSDTGTGMSEDVIARACEPFYTTKEPGKGSGLGLAQVYGLARQSGGGLQIRSRIGEGTTVAIYLPRTRQRPERQADQAEDQRPDFVRSRTTVLIVDDQDDVREIAAVQLETLGYRVMQAGSGEAALGLLRGGRPVDLLIVDYAMPGMSGADLARAARQDRPELPVLLITGYVETARVREQMSYARLLKKPYRMAELSDAIEALLSGRGQAGNVVTLRAKGAG